MALSEGVPLDQLNSQQVSELQNLLLRAGYNPGPVDGILGPNTRSAYSRFITKNGYDARGANTVVKLAADLWANALPELWEGVRYGGEVNAAATSGGQGAPLPQVTTAGTPGATPAAPTSAPASGGSPAPSTPYTPPPDAATEEQVRKDFPHLAYLMDNPEVRDVLLKAAAGGWDLTTLQGELWKTGWWQTTSSNMRLWDQKFAQDNATAMLEWDQRTVSISNLTSQLGFTLSNEDTKWIAGKVLREGWSDEQLKRFLGQLARQNGLGAGQISDQAAGFKALARSYLSTMSDQQAQEFAIRVAEGSISREGVESLLRSEAKSRFSWLAPQIDSGMTPEDLFGSTRNAVAQMLEVDPNQIDLNDPKWSIITAPVMEGNSMRSMNFYEAQRWARQRPEWRMTDNANQAASQIGLDLLKTMGVVA